MPISGTVCDKELLGSEGIWWSVLHNRATNRRAEENSVGGAGLPQRTQGPLSGLELNGVCLQQYTGLENCGQHPGGGTLRRHF